MTDIDVATGLPQLPENQFWRVESSYNDYILHPSTTVEVSIVERYTTQTDTWDTFLWFKINKLTVDVEQERILISQTVWHPDRFSSGTNEYTVFDGSKSRPAVHPSLVTPAQILMAAEMAVEKLAEKRKTESLFGDYPPKTLIQEIN